MYTLAIKELDNVSLHDKFTKTYECNVKGLKELRNDVVTHISNKNLPIKYLADTLINTAKSLGVNDSHTIVIGKTYFTLSRTKNKSNTSSINNIVESVRNAKSSKTEWHSHIYEDNCWWADIEVHPYGLVRFWVGFEDKRSGDCRGSLVTLSYLNNQGELRYCTDGIQIKKVVWDKIQRVAKALIKENLLTLQ